MVVMEAREINHMIGIANLGGSVRIVLAALDTELDMVVMVEADVMLVEPEGVEATGEQVNRPEPMVIQVEMERGVMVVPVVLGGKRIQIGLAGEVKTMGSQVFQVEMELDLQVQEAREA